MVLPAGRRLEVIAFGESPADAIERCLSLRPQAAPEPDRLAPGEVLLRVRSAGLSWVDLLMTSGQYQHMPQPPYVPGLEFAGEVLARGSAVDATRWRDGDRVLADFMQVGPRSDGAYRAVGGFATYAVVPAAALLPIPDGLDFDRAAVLLQAFETAYHCLVTRARLRAGEAVLIAGATGLTGLAAVQVARHLGAVVIALGRSADKLAHATRHGAHHAVTSSDDAGGVRRFRDEVKALTGGRGADVVFDAVGGDTSLECLHAIAFDGRFLIVGWTSTPDVARGGGRRGAPNANRLPTNLLQMKQLAVLGCPTVIAAVRDPSIRPARLDTVMGWARDGRIDPVVSQAWPLDDWQAAMRARWRGEVVGGCVLRP